jgi:hypothetical protein
MLGILDCLACVLSWLHTIVLSALKKTLLCLWAEENIVVTNEQSSVVAEFSLSGSSLADGVDCA